MEEQRQSVYESLTPKQRAWVDAYIECRFNASAASRLVRPGLKQPRNHGATMSTNPNIRSAITERLKSRQLDADRVIEILARHAAGSLEPFLTHDESGAPIVRIDGPEAQANLHLLKKVKVTRKHFFAKSADGKPQPAEVETVEFEIHDPQRAAELIGKNLGMFTDRLDVTSGGKTLLDIIRQREKDGANADGD